MCTSVGFGKEKEKVAENGEADEIITYEDKCYCPGDTDMDQVLRKKVNMLRRKIEPKVFKPPGKETFQRYDRLSQSLAYKEIRDPFKHSSYLNIQ